MLITAALIALTFQAQPPPPRPSLKQPADTNDWNAYYDRGVELLRRQPANAEAHFYWASRLAPNRAEPLQARWVAFWMRDQRRWIGYLRDQSEVLRLPEVIQADSLRYRASLRIHLCTRDSACCCMSSFPGDFRRIPTPRAGSPTPKAI